MYTKGGAGQLFRVIFTLLELLSNCFFLFRRKHRGEDDCFLLKPAGQFRKSNGRRLLMFRPAMARASSVSRDEGLSPAAAKALLDPRVSSAVAAALWELMQEQGGAMPGGS